MEELPNNSWAQPLTFAGIAKIAEKRSGVLFGYQIIVAIMAAAVVVTFFGLAWEPVFKRAIASLPDSGAIQNGELNWSGVVPVRTTGSSLLWLSINPADAAESGEGADLQVEAGRTELRLRSLFGYLAIPYQKGYRIAMNRTELEPWWGAWRPALIAGMGGAVVVGLFVTWGILGFAYAWPARFIAFYADRKLSCMGAWRLGAACLLPGALFFLAAIVAYTFHRINLVQLLGATVLHFMIGWVYLLFSPFSLPQEPTAGAGKVRAVNPFGTTVVKDPNPFSDRPRGKT